MLRKILHDLVYRQLNRSGLCGTVDNTMPFEPPVTHAGATFQLLGLHSWQASPDLAVISLNLRLKNVVTARHDQLTSENEACWRGFPSRYTPGARQSYRSRRQNQGILWEARCESLARNASSASRRTHTASQA